jgi:DNA-binding transcriptional LysR family regulator
VQWCEKLYDCTVRGSLIGAASLRDVSAKVRVDLMFDWNDLRYFLAVARQGSLASAAEALDVNPSTVQRRLQALETAAGCTLTERKSDGYRLTLAGNKMLADAERVEAAIDTFNRRISALDPNVAGHVKLTSHVTVGQRIIKSGFLDQFHTRHPGIRIELIMEQRVLDLSKGEADIAIRGGGADDGALVGKKIAEVPWAIFASAALVSRHGRPKTSSDLNNFGVVEFSGDIEGLPAARWMKSHAPNAPIVASCSNIPCVHLAIKSGAGLAPLPAVYAAADHDLIKVLGPIPELNYPLFLFTHKDLRKVPRVSTVFEFCLQELKPVLVGGEMRRRKSIV